MEDIPDTYFEFIAHDTKTLGGVKINNINLSIKPELPLKEGVRYCVVIKEGNMKVWECISSMQIHILQ